MKRTDGWRAAVGAVVLATLACAAIASRPARAQETPATTSVADRVFTDPAAPIAVRAGQLFLVALEANPSTGYHWAAANVPDPAVVALRGAAFLPTSGLVGAPGRELRVYEAVGAGSATIELGYAPPGRGSAETHRRFTVTVTPPDAR
jgi:predicted secreted protein